MRRRPAGRGVAASASSNGLVLGGAQQPLAVGRSQDVDADRVTERVHETRRRHARDDRNRGVGREPQELTARLLARDQPLGIAVQRGLDRLVLGHPGLHQHSAAAGRGHQPAVRRG